MWKTELTTTINGSAKKAWDVLVTPALWVQVDPKHYKEVVYAGKTLVPGTKGKMKTEDSPSAFGFRVITADEKNYETVTKSGIPFGALTITKRLLPSGKQVTFEEKITATGPFAKLFAKMFFQKQIADTLQAQHAAIKKYVESSK
jgi:hypothetical protein